MKNKIILSIFVSSLFFSCSDDFLQEDYSETNLTVLEGAITTNKDLENSVRGLYSSLSNSSGYGGDFFNYQELTADIGFVSVQNAGYFAQTNGGTHIQVEGGAGSGLWSAFYNSIANANFVLSFDGKLKDDKEATTSNAKFFAHAKAIRAYNYLGLLQFFSPNYGEGDQTLGVPYPTKYDITSKLPRESVSVVIDKVIEDLKSVITAFENSEDFTTTDIYTNKNSFNIAAIDLLLSRAYLYKKDYAAAQAYAEKVLVDGSSVLLPRNQVGTYYTLSGEDNPETLFQLEANNISGQALTQYWGSVSNYKQNFMSQNFWKKFNILTPPAARRDIRTTTWYTQNATVNAYPDLVKPIDIRKYTTSARDIVNLRKTEAVFIKAECQYHTSPTTAMATVSDWLKTYRFPDYVAPVTSGSGVLTEILDQKGFEFFLEGLRFSDLKRNNLPIIKYQTDVNGSPLTTIPTGDRRFIWPIPFAEMQNNPNVKQAPGY